MTHLFYNGEFSHENIVSPKDPIFINGIYETIHGFKNKIWNFSAHFKRLKEGSEKTKIQLTLTEEELSVIIIKLLTLNKFKETRVRITLAQDHLLITCQELVPETYENEKLVTYQGVRKNPEIKSNNRDVADKAFAFAQSHNAIDAILVDHEGNLTEGSISNFFMIKNGTLITPNKNILLGTTRELILQIAHKLKIPIEFRNIHLSELSTADEIFIANCLKLIVPIKQINDIILPQSKQGITRELIKEFQKLRSQ